MANDTNTIPFSLNLPGGASDILNGASGIGSAPPLDTTSAPPWWLVNPPPPYFNTAQIAGFNQMAPCSADCRDTGCDSYVSPVFGGPINGPSYTNDVSGFMATAGAGATLQWTIQKQSVPFFGSKTQPAIWNTAAAITDSRYGVYYPVGSMINPAWTVLYVNWGLVINALGPGIYRIVLNNCVPSGGSQASYNWTISSAGFPQMISGILTIGGINLTLDYNGDYTGYLNYLVLLINTTGLYTAVNTGTGVTISGTNYNLSNGKTISQTLTYTGRSFLALSSTTTSGASPLTENPMPFSTVVFNYGTRYNGATYIYTSDGTDPIQTFNVKVSFSGFAAKPVQFVSVTVTVTLKKNGVPYGPPGILTYTSIFGGPATFSWANVNLLNLDQISAEIQVSVTTNPISQAATSVISPVTEFWNTSARTTTSSIGTLTGGIAPGTACTCLLQSQPFELRAWSCWAARKTVKFESYITGTVGDAYNPGNLFVFNGFTFYDSIRFEGKFGDAEMQHEQLINVFGTSTSNPFGNVEIVRDKIVPKYILKSNPVPLWVYKGLEFYGTMANINLFVSDYNYNNADLNIQQKRVVLKGNLKPTYYGKGGFDEMWRNRLLKFEGSFDEGIQSGIMSNFSI